jgi:hypothetical protein
MSSRRLAVALSLSLAVPITARAWATVRIDDQTSLELGLRLHVQLTSTETDRDADGEYESQSDFSIRRARLRVRGDHGAWATVFVQGSFEEQRGTAATMRIIDAFAVLKPHPLAWLVVGQHMVPAMRQNVTGSVGFLALDVPALAYKALTTGGRAKHAFTNATFADSDAGLLTQSRAPVRDLGATLFGSQSFTPAVHLKYYLGGYDGVQAAGDDRPRIAARVQVNLVDPEPGYYVDGTYLGTRRTVGIGASHDRQDRVAVDHTTGRKVHYRLYSIDAFAEVPLPLGSLTAEAGYVDLDLGGGGTLATTSGAPLGDASRAQGDGFFVQAGYHVKGIQPWVGHERWTSDSTGGAGSYRALRAGVNYYLSGLGTKIVAGFERFDPDVAPSRSRDAIETFVLGLYLEY